MTARKKPVYRYAGSTTVCLMQDIGRYEERSYLGGLGGCPAVDEGVARIQDQLAGRHLTAMRLVQVDVAPLPIIPGRHDMLAVVTVLCEPAV